MEHGSAAGPPVGSGTIMLRAELTRGGKVVTTFTVDGSGGSITGQAVTRVHLGNGGVVYDGTAQLTSGTGDYRHLANSHITVTGSGTLTGHTVLHLTGSALY